jgi:hypothetical protein
LISFQLDLSLLKLEALLLKANFDPNQPRDPKGNPDGGKWTKTPGSRGVDQSRNQRKPKAGNPVGKPRPKKRPYTLSSKPPKLPTKKPSKWAGRIQYTARVAKWAARIAIRISPVGRMLDIYEAGHWIYNEAPYINSFLDDPKPLLELRDLVSKPEKGYEIHHIVEQAAARSSGYTEDMINSSKNKVRIPTYSHYEITGWFARGNENYNGLSPREYLLDKNWNERVEIGLKAMKKYGVLKP